VKSPTSEVLIYRKYEPERRPKSSNAPKIAKESECKRDAMRAALLSSHSLLKPVFMDESVGQVKQPRQFRPLTTMPSSTTCWVDRADGQGYTTVPYDSNLGFSCSPIVIESTGKTATNTLT